jgi:hypothetical protein
VGGRTHDEGGERAREPGPQPAQAAGYVLELQRAVGNRRTARILARGTAKSGAAPVLDERTVALEAELLDPSLAPQITSLRQALDSALNVANAAASLTPGGDWKTPAPLTVPAPLKLVNRLWKTADPAERRKLAKRLTGRPAATVAECMDISGKVLKDFFDACVWFAKGRARVGYHTDVLFTIARIEKLEKFAKNFGMFSDGFSALHGIFKLLNASEKTSERMMGGINAATGGSKLFAAHRIAKAGGMEFAPLWAIRLTAIGTAVEIAYMQQEFLASQYGKALTGTTAPSVERELGRLADAMRPLAEDRVRARHIYEHWARAQEDPMEAEVAAVELHDALRAYHTSINGALAAFNGLRYRAMKRPYLVRADELARLAELASADPASDAVTVYAAMEEIAGALYGLAAEMFKEKDKVLKAAAMENADRFHGREIE